MTALEARERGKRRLLVEPGEQVNSRTMAVIMILAILQTGILTLPARLAGLAGSDAWLATTAGAVVALVGALVMIALALHFPRQNLIQYLPSLAGKGLGVALGLAYIVFWLLQAANLVRTFAEAVKQFLLPATPLEIIIIYMLLVVIYLVQVGIQPIARVSEILVPLVVLSILLVILPALQDLQLSNLLPVLADGPAPVLKGGLLVAGSFQGMAAALMLVPFLRPPQKAPRAVITGVGLAALFYILQILLALGVFGSETARTLIWGTVSLAKTVRIPAGFVERFDILFVGFWVAVAFASLGINYYLASLGLASLMGFRDHRAWVYPLLPLVYFVAMLPRNLAQVLGAEGRLALLAVVFLYILPASLLLLARLQGRGGDPGVAGQKGEG